MDTKTIISDSFTGAKEKFINSNNKSIWYHLFFWLVVLVVLVITERNRYEVQITLVKELLNVAFFALVVYFNLLFLIPQYFHKKKYFLYTLLLVFSVVIISPIKTLALYIFFSGLPQIQARYIENQAFIFLSCLFVAFSSTIFQILMDWQRSDVEKKELEYKTTQTELNFLRSQINPHFLFNTLNNLYALTLKKSDAAPQTVLKLSEIMRYMLYECNERKVLLSQEINYLKNYIELEKLRLSSDFEIKLDVEGEVEAYRISPLLLTPFIENAFKHGINNRLNLGFIHMKIKIAFDELYLTIKNSKGDSKPVQVPKKKSGGIGLANVKRRLEILYPEKHKLDIQENATSYNVQLKIKLDI